MRGKDPPVWAQVAVSAVIMAALACVLAYYYRTDEQARETMVYSVPWLASIVIVAGACVMGWLLLGHQELLYFLAVAGVIALVAVLGYYIFVWLEWGRFMTNS